MNHTKLSLVAASVAVAIATTASANDTAVALTQPMKMGDTAMSCAQLLTEAGAMEQILGGSPAQGLMGDEAALSMGTGLAQRAAIQGGAAQAVGAIGAVGGFLGKRAKAKKEEQARIAAIAEKRWIYVVGLYQGRSCDAAPAE